MDTKSTKFNKLEKSWLAYDVGNSAFTLLVTTILPLYFNAMAEEAGLAPADYFAYWSFGTMATTLFVILLGPILGAIADGTKSKKQIFMGCVIFGVLTMGVLALPLSWISFLIFFVVAKVGYQASLIFYDAMLPDVTTDEKMDKLSSFGYAFGYIASCIPFILSLLLVLGKDKIGIDMKTAMAGSILINALWWVGFTIPLMKNYHQDKGDTKLSINISMVFRRIGNTLRELVKDKKIFFFLLSFFFYIDGVYTIIDLAVSYGDSIGLDSTALLLALLTTQVVAFPFALLFGYLSKKYPNHILIQICIVAYTLIVAFAVQLDKNWEFWLLAILVGMFQGGIQALSRSYFAQLIPKENSSEYFSIYDIFGKGASLTGTALVGFISKITGKQQFGIMAIVFIFLAGFFLFRKSVKTEKKDYNS